MKRLLLLVLLSVCWADHLPDSYTPDQDRIIHIQGKKSTSSRVSIPWNASDRQWDARCFFFLSCCMNFSFPFLLISKHASGGGDANAWGGGHCNLGTVEVERSKISRL